MENLSGQKVQGYDLLERIGAAEHERQEQKAHLERQANRRLKALVAVMALGLLGWWLWL